MVAKKSHFLILSCFMQPGPGEQRGAALSLHLTQHVLTATLNSEAE